LNEDGNTIRNRSITSYKYCKQNERIFCLHYFEYNKKKEQEQEETNKPKLFMFIGIAIVIGISLIILITLIFNPFDREPPYSYDTTTVTDRSKLSQQQQQCFDKYSKIYDFDKDNKTDEDEDRLVSEICDIWDS
jgi:hypothetical protein